MTYISEFIPSPREPLIIQKIAAVGASGDVSKGDGAHTQQGDARHLRVHNNNNNTEREDIRLEDTAFATKKKNTTASVKSARSADHPHCGGVFLLPCRISCTPDCLCSLPLSVTGNSSSLSLPPRSLSLRTGCLCAAENGSAHRARALRAPSLSLSLSSVRRKPSLWLTLGRYFKPVSVLHSFPFRTKDTEQSCDKG